VNAYANDLLAAARIDDVGVIVNPGSDLGVNCLGQKLACAFAEDLGEGISADGDWPVSPQGCRLAHGGGLLGLVGHMVNV
jgi:hypothetical protein